ncbi:hypothetical protein MCUN1_001872 [Malassezia cuniculi]|uniref:Uncharacterized protein n=1 Tax=Malassezia cuniculi TaxID=948313 RepID=A0AAF0JB78_9BASI|nr:hypothetical protein MCUN1_001872 [Malassezia cuniculi]
MYQELPSPPEASVRVPQLQCTLFGYQRNSLAKMLRRELEPGRFSDPYYIEKTSPLGDVYAFDPHSLAFLDASAVAQYADVRGGILCDEMGVGKTLICLALILHTRHQVAQPDAEPMASAVTSALALEFPAHDYKGGDPAESSIAPVVTSAFGAPTVGERLGRSRKPAAPQEKARAGHSNRPVSLVQIAAHRLRTTYSLSADDLSSLPPQLQTLLDSVSAPFFNLWPPAPARASRASRDRAPVRVYVSAATLALVPQTLIAQWLQEIEKHCPDTIRVLAVPDGRVELPGALSLAQDYDLVLMTHTRFGREAGDEQHGIRSDLDSSPLLQVYWKRVMVDEGNMMAGDSLVVRLCARLRVERRWLITGTPTQSLVGSSINGPTHHKSSSSSWSHGEKKDIDRLKHLLARFLHLPPYGSAFRGCGNERVWHALIAAAPAAPGEWPARRRLHDILARVMVRNRAQDIEAECPLPPLERRTVVLRLARHEQRTYNVLQALITLNAALSHETDRDYFFHPSNKRALAAVMENLALACFHFAGEGFRAQAEAAKELISRQLEIPGKVLDRYRESAHAALRHLSEATCDDSWRAHVDQGEVLYYLDAARRELVDAWSHRAPASALSLTSDELVAMRKALRNADVEPDDLLDELITRGMQYAARTAVKSGPRPALGEKKETASVPPELAVTALHSSSTKLNAILSEVLRSVDTDKVLIFSSLDNVLHEIAGALQVAQVPFLVYVSGVPQRVRNACISAFRHDETYRCLLMTTHVGGRGLDLHCASRVILAEPVWQLDLESQAIKRAWRMGQKRKVTVSTYAMEGTFEEQMVLRRNDAHSDSYMPARVFTDDPGMRDFVAHPRFVGGSAPPPPNWNIPVFQYTPCDAPNFHPLDTRKRKRN